MFCTDTDIEKMLEHMPICYGFGDDLEKRFEV